MGTVARGVKAAGGHVIGVIPEFMKSRNTDVTSFLASLIAQSPALTERLADAQMTGPATATGNYSYRAGQMTGKNFIMLGDAPSLDGKYTVFGQVESGMEFVDKVKAGSPVDNGHVDDPTKIIKMQVASDVKEKK